MISSYTTLCFIGNRTECVIGGAQHIWVKMFNYHEVKEKLKLKIWMAPVLFYTHNKKH